MTYEEWFLNQAKLHKTIMNKLEDKSIDEMIEYFKYENMKKNEPDFCPLYKLNKKWGIKAVYQFLFIEYKTSSIKQTSPDGTIVTRFRNKANDFGIGGTYHF